MSGAARGASQRRTDVANPVQEDVEPLFTASAFSPTATAHSLRDPSPGHFLSEVPASSMSDAEHYSTLQSLSEINVRAPPPPPPPAPGPPDPVANQTHGPADAGIHMAVAAAAAAAAAHEHDEFVVSHDHPTSIGEDDDVLNLVGDEDGHRPVVSPDLPQAASSSAISKPAWESTEAQSEEKHAYPPESELEGLQFTDVDLLTAELHKLATRHGFVITKVAMRKNVESKRKLREGGHDALLALPAEIAEDGTSSAAAVHPPSGSLDDTDWLRTITWGCSCQIKRKAKDSHTSLEEGEVNEAVEITSSCKWRLRGNRSTKDGPFALKLVQPFHNHRATESIQTMRLYRLQQADKARIWNLYFQEGYRPRHVQVALSNEDRVITSRQVEDFVHNWRAMAPTDQVEESLKNMGAARQRLREKSSGKDEFIALLQEKTAALEDESTPAMQHALKITSVAERKRTMESSNVGKTGKGRNYKRNDLQPREQTEKPQGARAHKNTAPSTRRRQRDGGDSEGASTTATPGESAPPAKRARRGRDQMNASADARAAAPQTPSKSDAEKLAATEKARLAAETAYHRAFRKAMQEAGLTDVAPHSLPPPLGGSFQGPSRGPGGQQTGRR